MTDRYTVRVEKDELVFSAGHFITYGAGECERLHGHNYRVAVELSGDLDDNQYVFDFIALRDRTRQITDRLDHRMLVPAQSRRIACEADDRQVTLRVAERTWTFPREDCVLLPVANTTSEQLAKYIAGELRESLQRDHAFTPAWLRVEVEESFGQRAGYDWRPG
jgi:6-pyruvoyltetrahydropterin/6-carboxytetrahydropterin synthase